MVDERKGRILDVRVRLEVRFERLWCGWLFGVEGVVGCELFGDFGFGYLKLLNFFVVFFVLRCFFFGVEMFWFGYLLVIGFGLCFW